jgi:hypothetical protein
MKNRTTRDTEIEQAGGLAQLNARVPVPMKETVKASAKRAGFNMEVIMRDMVCMYSGVTTPDIEERRNVFIRAMEKVTGGKLPFNSPHNAGSRVELCPV